MVQADSSQRIKQLLRIDELRHRFESSWRAGDAPRLEQYLAEMEQPLQGALLFELLGVELQVRLQRGESLQASQYHARFPQYGPHVERAFREAIPDRPGPPTQLGPGRVLGDFRLVRELARGGMGVVYQAEQLSLGRPVALKVLSVDQWARDDARARFLREARAAATLHHTNIVPVLEVGEQDGMLFYAMQLIQGRPLQSLLVEMRRQRAVAGGSERSSTVTPGAATPGHAENDTARDGTPPGDACDAPGAPAAGTWPMPDETVGTLSEADRGSPSLAGLLGPAVATSWDDSEYRRFISRIGRQVAEALHYAHEHGIVHRDVKPANVLVDTEGNAWITDFGLAKLDDSDLTRQDEVIGTLRFLAPEALDGYSDARSDVYSLGLTLYELLSLLRPFSAKDKSTLIQQVHASEIVPLSRAVPDMPRDLATIVSKATQRAPQDRYQTAWQLADDLDRFLRDEPILARHHTAAELAWRWIVRHPALSSLAGSLVLLLALLAIGSSVAAVYFHRLQTQQRQLADERETQRGAAASAAAKARGAEQQVLSGLARLHAEQGLHFMEQGDDLRALLSTVQALVRLEEAGVTSPPAAGLSVEESLRYRVSALLQEVPKVVARRAFHEHDWTREVLDRFTLARGPNTPQLHYRPDGALSVVSKYSDVALCWNVETGSVQRVLSRLSASATTNGEPAEAFAGPSSAVRFTRDARHAVRFSDSGELELWQCEPPQRLCGLENPPGDASSLLACWLTPDGRQVLVGFASGIMSGDVFVWDAHTGSRLHSDPFQVPSQPRPYPLDVRFSRNGRRAMLLGRETQVVELQTGAVLVNAAQEVSAAAAFGQDGGGLVAPVRNRVCVWDLDAPPGSPPSGEVLLPPDVHVLQAASDEQGRWVVFGTSQGDLYVFDVAQNSLAIAPISHGRQMITGLEVSPRVAAVAVADAAGLVRVWSMPSGVPLTPPLRHPEPVSSLAWRPDGQHLAVATVSGEITVWDVSARASQPGSSQSTRDVAIAPDGRQMLAWGSGDGVSLWDLTERPPRVTASLPLDTVRAAGWHHDGTKVALIADSPESGLFELRIWELSAGLGQPLKLPGRYRWEGSFNSFAFAGDGEALVLCTIHGLVGVDLAQSSDRRRVETFLPSPQAPLCSTTSSRHLAACSRLTDQSKEHLLRVWLLSGELVFETPLVSGLRVKSLAFSPDGALLVAAGDLGVRMWRTSDWQPVPLDALGRTAGIELACFDGASRRLALVDSNAVCRVMQLDEPLTCGPPFRLPGTTRDLAFSRDGKRLAVVTLQEGVTVWDWLRGQPVAPTRLRKQSLRRVLFAPDDATLAVVHWGGGLEWLSVPPATDASVEDLLMLSQRATGYSVSRDGESEYLWASEWQRLGHALPLPDGPVRLTPGP